MRSNLYPNTRAHSTPLRYCFIQYRNADGQTAFTSTMCLRHGQNPKDFTTSFVRANFVAVHEACHEGVAGLCCS